MKLVSLIPAIALIISIFPAAGHDNVEPEGWATCATVGSAADYDLTGGADGRMIVLRSDGSDMRDEISRAIEEYDVIIFDGRDGDFALSSTACLYSLSGKSLIGVNGARLCTSFTVSDEIKQMLDDLDVKSLSSNPNDNLGGTLSNGSQVNEQCELTIRQAIIDRFGDSSEQYRHSGIFALYNCSNVIVSNLDFVGPGAIDVGGDDLLTLIGSDHVWVNHCRFTDGMDGNLDIVQNSDFVTVSDVHFRYTEQSYNHPLSNLTSGTEYTDGLPQTNNISWIRCFWDNGCYGRMPFTSLGIHHILNCYWDSKDARTCIDAHDISKILIEKSNFSPSIKRPFVNNGTNVRYECRDNIWPDKNKVLQSNDIVNVPYQYSAIDAADVPLLVKTVGPTLGNPYERILSATPAAIEIGEIYSTDKASGVINIAAFGTDVPTRVIVSAPDGIMLATDPTGEYSSTLVVDADDDGFFQKDIYCIITFDTDVTAERAIEVSAAGHSFSIPLIADVVQLSGEGIETTLIWPFDNTTTGNTDAKTNHAELFSHATFSLGDKISIHSVRNLGSSGAYTLFNPIEAIGKTVDEQCCITFDVVAAPDYIFIPKTLTFNAARVATDMCFVDVECSREEGATHKILTTFHPERSSDSPGFSEIKLPIANMGTGDNISVKIYLYNMSVNKQLALSNVRIEGIVYPDDAASVSSVISTGATGSPEYYDLYGRKVSHIIPDHIYIVRYPSGHSQSLLIKR